MTSTDLVREIANIGRELNAETLLATRTLLGSLVPLPDPEEVHVQRDIHYGGDPRQRMDVFTPASGFEPQRPLLVFVHGGGFVSGDKHAEGSPFYSNVGVWALRRGYNAIAMTYRLAPEHRWPSGQEDIQLLLEYLRRAGTEHGVAAEQVFLMGHSAGASHVASYLVGDQYQGAGSQGLSGVILLSGLYDYTSMDVGPMGHAYLGEDEKLYGQRSSLQGLLKTRVPLLVCMAEFDPPVFHQQGLALLNGWQQTHGSLPHFTCVSGQNHLSTALALGLERDLLGPQLQAFVDRYSRKR